MARTSDSPIERMLSLSIERRALLRKGVRFVVGLQGLVGFGMAGWFVSTATGCYRAPGTARDQFITISEEKEMAMGISAFHEILRKARLSDDLEINEMVNRVGGRIAAAANKPEYQWEFVVIQDDRTVNAFALPGGKVAVFTGILKFTQNENGLATVMGHEVAHVLQRHGAERYSRGILETIAQVGALAAGAAAGRPDAAVAAMSAYGVGVSLPFGRSQESEADFIGLRLMAQAGYDPREAVPFWERMSGCPRQLIGKACFRAQQNIPEFLSTHPSDSTRLNQIEAWLPDALKHYRGSERQEPSPAQPYRPAIGPPQPS
ncbi:putative Peptidase M48, Ste24p [Candidatus Nitrospira inopinata]|jgi:predicted Zn-dependent protease|uniref:Putative Peptidase M48, Ste24p n=2 Tax=Candidatus Nitrospira inopinata TaxID=1715989 RepID=A0A0S4KZG3_9BACT|nr:putative Peptidase M48, Ste24p [Candidatus Nitrospira inopinata]